MTERDDYEFEDDIYTEPDPELLDDLSELPSKPSKRRIPRRYHNREPVTAETRQRPRGRPSEKTPQVIDEFIFRMTNGMSLNKICSMPDMPSTTTIMRWVAEDEQFAKMYHEAKIALADYLADETLEIVDDARNDYMEKLDKKGHTYIAFNPENVQRAKLRLEQRKWYVSILAPHKYSPKVDLNHGGQPGNPIAMLIAQINSGVKPASQRTPEELEHYRQLDYDEDDDSVQDADFIDENGEPQ